MHDGRNGIREPNLLQTISAPQSGEIFIFSNSSESIGPVEMMASGTGKFADIVQGRCAARPGISDVTPKSFPSFPWHTPAHAGDDHRWYGLVNCQSQVSMVRMFSEGQIFK